MQRSLLFIFLFVALAASAQKLPQSSFRQLKKTEDTMKRFARQMVQDENAGKRFSADSVFVRMLVRSLRTPNSFNYPFDSLETVSRVYAPDSSFRIFTWEFSRDENFYRQRGAIQMKTSDGSLKLYPLFDASEFTMAPQDSIRGAQNWIGAIYYGIVMKTFNDKKYYTLLGFDDNNMKSTKKWIEVLTFDQGGRPVFGGPYFAIRDTTNKKKETYITPVRYCVEYKREGGARVNYDPDMDMIIYDHLESESKQPDKAYTLVPDGDFVGFKWEKGRWTYVDKIFDFKLKDGEAPTPEPLKDENGRSNEQKLILQSEKNMKSKETETPKNTPPPKNNKKSSQPNPGEEY